MAFVNGKNDGNGIPFDVTKSDSNRHSGISSKNSGENEIDKVCNIYDLEGNKVEFVAEKYNNIPIYRGGYWFFNAQSASHRCHDAYTNGKGDNERTFRFILYVIPRDNWTPSYDEQTTYTDENGDTATIPVGFSVSRKPNEKTINDGLVVKAPDGSEFVWVPVEDINTMAQCSTAGGDCNLQLQGDELICTTHNSTEIVGKLYATTGDGPTIENFGTVNTTYNENSGLREPAVVTSGSDYDAQYYSNAGFSSLDDMKNGLKNEYKEMATSVAKYKGFYVGRYETSLSTATAEEAGTSDIVQSKKGVLPNTQSNSSTALWYGIYKAEKAYATTESLANSNVGSSMIWGSQYDAMLNWAKKGEDGTKITEMGKNRGNHSGTLTVTGNSKYSNDNINNIMDLEGNLLERTIEAEAIYRIDRGGSLFDALRYR